MFDCKWITEALVELDRNRVQRLIDQGLHEGIPAVALLNEGLVAGMTTIGDQMERDEIFVPEVLKAAKIMRVALETLKPKLADGGVNASGRVVLGTVKGDLHDIGKNLVAMMLENAGFDVFDLGVDVSPERFVAEVREKKASLLGLSALLTTTTQVMKTTVDAVIESGLRDSVRIMIGGAPATQGIADECGADGYAPDAGSAMKLAKALQQ
jgi:5-methyltetrahydrofolate--homocysteine methyltransferase